MKFTAASSTAISFNEKKQKQNNKQQTIFHSTRIQIHHIMNQHIVDEACSSNNDSQRWNRYHEREKNGQKERGENNNERYTAAIAKDHIN